jgi:hypothetical protein
LGGGLEILRIEVAFCKYVVDTVCSERYTHTRYARHAEDAREVIVTATTCDTTDLYVKGFDFKDSARIVVEATSKAKV